MIIHSYDVPFIKGKDMKASLQEHLIAARRNQILDLEAKWAEMPDFLTDMILDERGSDKS
jgi:hypothetical protein